MCRSVWMLLALALLSSIVCCYAQPPPPPPPPRHPSLPFEKDSSIRFPVERDILFPGPDESEEEKTWYRIREFRFNQYENLPEPMHRHHRPPPRPGQPFPPPPSGYKKPGNRNGRRRLCEQKYSEYVERIFPNDTAVVDDANDANFDGRILAKPGQYPHMAAVGFETETQQIEYKCGGSLISENFVVTAAHCTAISDLIPKWVRIGDLNLMIDEQTVEPQVLEIDTIYKHPDYNKDLYYNDIALLKLSQNVHLTKYVRPIRLWVFSELPTTIAFAMGYGATSFAKAMTNRLTNLNLTIVPNDECNRELPALSETPDGVLASQICGQDYILNRDTCQGDSGGPLQLNLPGRRRQQNIHYHLIGLTSYGVFCRSSYPSVYTRISSYLDWIEQITWSAELDLV